MKQTITEIRVNKVLDTQLNYQRWGIMTRREFVHNCILKGIEIVSIEVRNYAAEQKETAWLEKNSWSHPWGNINHPQTISYNDRKNALKEGFFKTEYRAMYADGSMTVCTKIEYDYYSSKIAQP